MTAVRWEGASLGYGGRPVLSGVELDIPVGGFTLLQGGNGAGKTTLVRSLRERQLLLSGDIFLDPRLRGRMAYLPQERALRTELPLTVGELLFMGTRRSHGSFRGLFRRHDDRTGPLLERLGLTRFRDTLLRECSGGTLKKALLGRVLIGDPELLILDEPFAEVDRESADAIRDLLVEENRQRGVTVIVVSHLFRAIGEVPLVVYTVREGGVVHGLV